MSNQVLDAVVIGAGVIGLAIARKLALCGLETIILEQVGSIGTGTSSRNSEVIHAGLYYPPGSIKARCCVAGRRALYAYCADRGVKARAVGKILLAVEETEIPKLAEIAETGRRNGVLDLVRLSQAEIAEREPDLQGVAALLSPSTGIIDSHAYMQALRTDFEAAGGWIAFNTPVAGLEPVPEGTAIMAGGKEPSQVRARIVINAAGHGAPRLGAGTKGLKGTDIPPQHFAKGSYFSLLGRQPFRHLVYPMPDQAGLGIHATIDLNGRCRFGPDVEWVDDDQALAVDPQRAGGFYRAIRRYWPALADGALQPDYAGIRPKIHARGSEMPDFRIDGPSRHGLKGLVNLFGIESPGLTASLAIAHLVACELGLSAEHDSLI